MAARVAPTRACAARALRAARDSRGVRAAARSDLDRPAGYADACGSVSPRVRGSSLVQPLRVLRPRARRVDAPTVRHPASAPSARRRARRRARGARRARCPRRVRRVARERRRHVARSDVALVRARDVRGGRAGSARRGVLRRPRGGGEGGESAGGGRGGGRGGAAGAPRRRARRLRRRHRRRPAQTRVALPRGRARAPRRRVRLRRPDDARRFRFRFVPLRRCGRAPRRGAGRREGGARG